MDRDAISPDADAMLRLFRRLLIAVVGAMLTGYSIQAQTTSTGIVVDSTGTPIPAVTIVIQDSAGGTRRTMSDEGGTFSLADVAAGKAVVTTEAVGWDPVSVDVSLPVGADGIRLVIRPAGIAETVVVIGSIGARRTLHPD